MAKIVIDIPDFLYKQILKKHVSKATIARVFQNGIILPKGHGRLIDADEIIHLTNEIEAEDREEESYHLFLKTVLTDAPTIIEADKEGER